MNVDFYTSKHAIIKQLLAAIERTIESGISEKNTIAVFTVLSKLASTVSLHLASEDEYLYPKLLGSPSAETRAVAEMYKDKMLGIAAAFQQFMKDFNSQTAILAGKDEFVRRFRTINTVLRERIEKEETELYPFL